MPSDRDRFASKLARAITKASLGEVRYLPQDFALEIDGSARVNLHNAMREYEQAGLFGKGKVIKRWVEVASWSKHTNLPESFEQARANILPYVRDRNFHEHVRLYSTSIGQQSAETPFEVLGGELTVAAAYDGEMTIAGISQAELDKWGVSLDEALKAARLNIRMRTHSGFARVARGLYLSPYRDNHDTARIVLTELISRLDVMGDPVALAPQRDSLIITGSEDPENLAEAARMTLELLKDSRRISGHAVCFRGGTWQPFMPLVGSQAHEPMKRAQMMTLAYRYEQQKELLQKLEGDDVFVASFKIRELAEVNRWRSYSVWIDGLPTWLPVSDQIIFQSERFGDDQAKAGPWDWAAVAETAGALMQARDIKPPRVFVKDFPTDEMFLQMARRTEAGPGR